VADCRHWDSQGPDGAEVSNIICASRGFVAAARAVNTFASPTHTHESLVMYALGPGQRWKTWFEIDRAFVGPCPPGLLPGQHLMPDGTVVDEVRLARGHFGGPPAAAGSADAEASEAEPPIRTVPLAATGLLESPHVECEPSLNGAVAFDQVGFPFGPAGQPWRVHLRLQINPDGQPDWSMDLETPGDRGVYFYDREPNYTVRVGANYAFTPPISQHDYVFGHGGPPLTPGAAETRDAARKAAQARGETYCYVFSCDPSAPETEAFLGALEATAAAGGDLTVSGPGPTGPVTVRYPLSGLQGLRARLLQCRK
jgi:hypothetical protein